MQQDEAGLNLLDYGKRFYDPVLGRFTGIDPIAEKYNWVTPATARILSCGATVSPISRPLNIPD